MGGGGGGGGDLKYGKHNFPAVSSVSQCVRCKPGLDLESETVSPREERPKMHVRFLFIHRDVIRIPVKPPFSTGGTVCFRQGNMRALLFAAQTQAFLRGRNAFLRGSFALEDDDHIYI